MYAVLGVKRTIKDTISGSLWNRRGGDVGKTNSIGGEAHSGSSRRFAGFHGRKQAVLLESVPVGLFGAAGDALGTMLGGFEAKPPETRTLAMPDEFKPLNVDTNSAFVDYLRERGFKDNRVLAHLATKFNLRKVYTGEFAYRLIFPVYDETGALITWTGRSIGDHQPRYKTLTATPGNLPGRQNKPIAIKPITDCLLGLNKHQCNKNLIVVEGPMDVLNLSNEAWWWNDDVTCIFGKAVSDAQLDILAGLRDSYKNIYMILDPEASIDALHLESLLATAGVEMHLLQGEHDPGEMSQDEQKWLFHDLAERTARKPKAFAK